LLQSDRLRGHSWLSGLILNQQVGQALAEYALILALIAILAIAALQMLGTNIQFILTAIAESMVASAH